MSQLSVDQVDKQSGSTLTLGGAGTTVQPHASATVSGFLPSSISTSGDDFQFNSGYGSVATAYGCRAWVNFNGSGTVAIRGSGNVSSITDNSTGDYTVNFTNAMPDDSYSISILCNHPSSMISPLNTARGNPLTSKFHIYTLDSTNNVFDANWVFAQVIR